MELDVDDLIRVKTAADKMAVTSQYIYTLIKDEKLKAVVIDEVTFVSRKAVNEFDSNRDNKRKR